MAMINCHECKAEISSTAKACPKCGAKVPHAKWWLWAPLGLVAAVLVLGSMRTDPPMHDKDEAYRVVAACWSRYRGNIPPAEQRKEGERCQHLESEYNKRHGSYPGPW